MYQQSQDSSKKLLWFYNGKSYIQTVRDAFVENGGQFIIKLQDYYYHEKVVEKIGDIEYVQIVIKKQQMDKQRVYVFVKSYDLDYVQQNQETFISENKPLNVFLQELNFVDRLDSFKIQSDKKLCYIIYDYKDYQLPVFDIQTYQFPDQLFWNLNLVQKYFINLIDIFGILSEQQMVAEKKHLQSNLYEYMILYCWDMCSDSSFGTGGYSDLITKIKKQFDWTSLPDQAGLKQYIQNQTGISQFYFMYVDGQLQQFDVNTTATTTTLYGNKQQYQGFVGLTIFLYSQEYNNYINKQNSQIIIDYVHQ